MMNNYNAGHEFINNLKQILRTLKDSIFRRGKADSDRAKSQAMFQNLFYHIHPVKVHKNSLRLGYTFGLGVMAFAFFVLCTITGILLMVYYKPSVHQAYDSIKDIHYVVPTGRFIRNIHRWAAHGMVIVVILHMARVFFTGSYKSPREFNWLVGISLLVLTLGLSFTGYLLPWDQLAFWAVTIGSNIAASPREITDALGITHIIDIGGIQKKLLLGANTVGQEALIRFYLLHIMVLPLALVMLVGIHFWRIRKDGGLSRPEDMEEKDEMNGRAPLFERISSKTYGLMCLVKGNSPAVNKGPENTLISYPNLLLAELAGFMITIAISLVLAFYLDAPLKEIANPSIPENPAKAPWYFLGLQELVSYSAFMGGIGIPAIVLIGLGLIPYLDREKKYIGIWFSNPEGKKIAFQSLIYSTLVVIGTVAFTINFGWLRVWFPDIPQIIITLINPGTLIVVFFAAWSIYVLKKTNSTRMAAIALFTCFLVGFTILTYVGTSLRGPNWGFYWSKSQWPVH